MSRQLRRRALLIGTEFYRDEQFPPLPSTRADSWQLRQVLDHRHVGGFESVRPVANLTADDMRAEIAEFLESCSGDELALLYVTGHGTRLRESTGEFFFVASDTDYDQVARTGVDAGFVNDQLEACQAPHKVAILDCCLSGGFALGFKTSDSSPLTAKSSNSTPLNSRGVYVLASSGAGEDSFSGAAGPAGPEPSLFTGEIIEALRTGKAGAGSSGQVSVDELFEYVNRRMRRAGGQIPTKSSLAVNDRIVIASRPHGTTIPMLAPLSRQSTINSPAEASAPAGTQSQKTAPSWRQLIDYYRECVLSDEVESPLMSVTDHGDSYICMTGQERLLSGDLDEFDSIPLPEDAAEFVDETLQQDSELWAGYPAIVLIGPRGGKPWPTPRFAPLLVRRVEVIPGEGEAVALRPYGPVLPHPRLARDWLGSEEASQLIEAYQPTWHSGQLDRLAADVRNLLMTDFELPCVQEIRPDDLADHIDIHSPGHGARNVAILYRTPRDTGPTRNLTKDLAFISQREARIGDTALAGLLSEERLPEQTDVHPVTPLSANDAQLDVLFSAMTRRITAATGPPGTGKSQLVANVVATAMAHGESVLVASTNNQAVDEVWHRCERLIPGSVVRTGSSSGEKDYRRLELTTLQQLVLARPTSTNLATARADLNRQIQELAAVRRNVATAARLERELRQAGEAREQSAEALSQLVITLSERMGSDQEVLAWERRARRMAGARLFGEWRRARMLGKLGLAFDQTTNACANIANFAAAEKAWRRSRREVDKLPTDADFSGSLETAEAELRRASRNTWQTAISEAVNAGRQTILGLIQAKESSGDWAALRGVLPHVRGWATTSLSARRFPTDPCLFDLVIIDEASQCAISHVVPLLFRARRALVIGDVMQLQHITNLVPEREATIRRRIGIPSSWLEQYRLSYRRHSAFHAAEHAAGGSLLLDEHYRCHPDIAGVSNRLFYGERLNVLTDVHGRPSVDRPAITWANTAGRAMRPNSGASWVNREEIDMVCRCVNYLLRHLPDSSTIGVVTPFKAQQAGLDRFWPGEPRVRVGTVHTFQGGECDAMVFSLVAADGMSPGAISWIDRQINLWNVGITRARSHLIVVGDAELWRKRGGTGGELLRSARASTDADQQSTQEPNSMLQRFYDLVAGLPGVSIELGNHVHGYVTDATVMGSGSNVSVLLDSGAPDGMSDERHLRLMLRRRELLDLHPGGPKAIRLPTWKIYDAPSVFTAVEIVDSTNRHS